MNKKEKEECFLYTCPKCTNGFYIKDGFINANCPYCQSRRSEYTWKMDEVKEIRRGRKPV